MRCLSGLTRCQLHVWLRAVRGLGCEQANDQVVMAEEKETMLRLQIAEYERQKDELTHDIEEARRRKAAEFEPYAKELQQDIDDTASTIQQQKSSIQKMDTEKKECIASIQGLQDQLKGMKQLPSHCATVAELRIMIGRTRGRKVGALRRAQESSDGT